MKNEQGKDWRLYKIPKKYETIRAKAELKGHKVELKLE